MTTPHHEGTANVKKGEDSPEYIIRSKFEDELANFMLKKKSRAKWIGDMLVQHPPPRLATDNFTEGETEKEGHVGAELSIIQEPAPQPSILYQPSKSSNLPFPSRLKKQKKDDEDERLLSIFKQIHINLPFLEAMIHMPKRANVLKDLLSHKEKLEKVASSVKLKSIGENKQVHLPSRLCSFGNGRRRASPNHFREALPRHGTRNELHEGKLSLRVRSETVTFNIEKSIKSKHSCDDYLYCADHTAKLVQEQWIDTVNHDGEWTKEEEVDDLNEVLAVSFYPRTEPVEPLEWKAPENRLNPSCMESPKLELKELPEHLEYAFLQENNQLPVVISSALSTVKKTRLLEVLRNHKGTIAWSIADIKGIDSSFCTHKILLEDEFKPSVQPQRRLTQEGGITVVKNKKDELIPQRTVIGWRICIDYRKLNNATRKDHFPLPFIDQMLERLAGHEYYCFLDGFSGYFQIPIAPEDQ
ncbi:hypothetical protein Tco_1045298 [Tanacetum coccineum]|uniref:Reverse transcriptase domain-containing protein n=1 Tax=Tanacetum coccineum TaxID=301880 RepID=A0ABQ5GST4_9ASTR